MLSSTQHAVRQRSCSSGMIVRRRMVHLPSKSSKTKIADCDKEALEFLAERGRALGISLSPSERKLIIDAAATKNGKMRKSDWEKLVSRRFLEDQERLTLADYLLKSHDVHLGQHLLQWTTRLGISFFAMAGAYTAGEAGMHVVGSTIVGCVTALGGGTFNNLVTGANVGWVRNPSFLVITVGASLVGFYAWPLVVEKQLQEIDGHNSSEAIRYALESVALGSLAVVGAQQGIVRGLHPLVSSILGVTITFGGVVRDLMCSRDLKVGASTGCQSYGIASFSGAAVYVMLRELHVWNCAGSTSKLVHGGIPIGLRIFLGLGTVFGVRAIAWWNKPNDLFSSMEASAVMNQKSLQNVMDFWRSEPK
jgi:uncharacterized membrane protein YeiH